MLLATGIAAISAKVADERAKKKEAARQLQFKVGDSDAAKEAFGEQTTNSPEPGETGIGETGIRRAGTQIKYEDPSDISANSPTVTAQTVSTPTSGVETLSPWQSNAPTTSRSERGMLSPVSPYDEIRAAPSEQQSLRTRTVSNPPPYSSRPASSVSGRSPSLYSRDSDANSVANCDTKSLASRSTNSNGTHAIRVKTIGSDLKSGFAYHPALFDLRIHPDQWATFTSQIVQSTKFGVGDHAHMWAAATATALTGAIGTSIYVGRTINRSLQEKKVKEGLTSTVDGGLGDTLKKWNDDYFLNLGLFVHLELSESAMKSADQKSKALRRSAFMYSKREEREKKKDERKFVIVVTKLDDEGQPMEALHELSVADKTISEIGSSDGPPPSIPELPADEGVTPVELPAETPTSSVGSPGGYVEMSGDNSQLLEKLYIHEKPGDCPPYRTMVPDPLSVRYESRPVLDKETR